MFRTEIGKVSTAGDDAANGARKTPIAVALDYDPTGAFGPKVVASGKGAIAEQILRVAFATGVKVRQDADLAEILSAIEVDTEIPVETFAAVAEILAYVYRVNGTLEEKTRVESRTGPAD